MLRARHTIRSRSRAGTAPGRGWRAGLALACLLLLASGGAAAAAPKSVLILSSESLQMPGLALLAREVSNAVSRAPSGPVIVYTESLERSRFPGDDQRLLALLAQRYAGQQPGVVVALGAPAAEFAIRYRSRLFDAATVLYGFLDEEMAAALDASQATTGVSFRSVFLQSTDVILALHPRVRRIALVGGTSEFDRGMAGVVPKGRPAAREPGRHPVPDREHAARDCWANWRRSLTTALVLYLSMTRDRDGAVYVPRDVLEMIRRVTIVPVYGPAASYLGHGVVGGPVFDLDAHGKALGRMAARLLSGEAVSAVKPEVTPSRLVFDWRELRPIRRPRRARCPRARRSCSARTAGRFTATGSSPSGRCSWRRRPDRRAGGPAPQAERRSSGAWTAASASARCCPTSRRP